MVREKGNRKSLYRALSKDQVPTLCAYLWCLLRMQETPKKRTKSWKLSVLRARYSELRLGQQGEERSGEREREIEGGARART